MTINHAKEERENLDSDLAQLKDFMFEKVGRGSQAYGPSRSVALLKIALLDEEYALARFQLLAELSGSEEYAH